MKKRAIQDHEKLARRQTILDAAWKLLDEKEVQHMSVAEVARRAGLAKGTIYLYFKTKEEIFVSLLTDQFDAWSEAILAMLRGPEPTVELLAQCICSFAADRPKFMLLASSSRTVLEQNLGYEAAAAYKKGLAFRIDQIGKQVELLFPKLNPGEGATLLTMSYAMILGIWQLAEPTDLIKEVFEKEGLTAFQINFAQTTPFLLTKFWHGLFPGKLQLEADHN